MTIEGESMEAKCSEEQEKVKSFKDEDKMKKDAGHEKMENKSAMKIEDREELENCKNIEMSNQKDELGKEERESTDINQSASRGTSKLLNEHMKAEDTIKKEMDGGNKKEDSEKIGT